ncbi:MAG: hypothetical protein II211_02100 [Peptococcaceae bacterium]|nr:hypothetical protein [Peptococcaceae bacterium]
MNKIQQICGDGLQDYRLNENELNINIPRVLVGAIQGRSGKTTFTLGLLKSFSR